MKVDGVRWRLVDTPITEVSRAMFFKFSGDELRQRRRAAGLSVERLAIAVGRSYASIALYERNEVCPPTPVVAALAHVLECHPGDLYAETAPAAS